MSFPISDCAVDTLISKYSSLVGIYNQLITETVANTKLDTDIFQTTISNYHNKIAIYEEFIQDLTENQDT